MLVIEAINGLKQKYINFYGIYVRVLMGAFQDSILSAPFFRSDALYQFDTQATIAKNNLSFELKTIRADMAKLVNLIPHQVSDPKHISVINSFIDTLARDVEDSINVQASRDIKQFKQMAVEAQMGVMLNNEFSNPFKLQDNIRAYAMKKLVFVANNGTRWKSERYVATVLNWAFHRVYNESYIYLAKLHGIPIVFAVSDKGKLQMTVADYKKEEFQKKVFHPNSDRIISS